ncbi:MAG TPA: sugar transferase, partial [Actinomycetes bacterium]
VVASLARFGVAAVSASDSHYAVIASVIGAAWMLALVLQRSYEPRVLGLGGEEYRRVVRAAFWVFGITAVVSYVGKTELARGYVALAFPLGLALLLLGRFAVRSWLKAQRRRGRLCHRVVVVGDRHSVGDFVTQLQQEPAAGFVVVGVCLPSAQQRWRGSVVPVLGGHDDVAAAAARTGADVVAVTASESITPARLRRIAWSLEGSAVDLVVAPAVTDVAGPRITVRPVAGLPLLYVDEPRLSGGARLVKGVLDRVGSLALLVVLSPLLAVVGILVRATSQGPAIFAQQRVGLGGKHFAMYKFRSMFADAEQQWDDVRPNNDAGGMLFKMRDDPRVTRIGWTLRRTSIDELPQLVNVLRGQMSLVGPRPLAVAAGEFVGDEQRRHLVKPGITGLWQISGRAQQSWDDAIRLDLYYVENWSLPMDLLILLRTVVTVFRGGAR